jgi:hypothetical protein
VGLRAVSSSSSDDQPPVEVQLAIAKQVILQLGLTQMHRPLSDESMRRDQALQVLAGSARGLLSPLVADCLAPTVTEKVFVVA